MDATYPRAMTTGVFPHEGGYTNDPRDPGGPTNWGVTIADARLYWKPNATAADVRAMPIEVAEDIYAKHYAAPLRYDDLPAGVDYSVLDYGINSGIGRAGKVLRRVCALPDNTSAVTDDVIRAVCARDPKLVIAAIDDERLRFLQSLKTWPTFGKGWGRRVVEVKALSLAFVDQYASKPRSPDVMPTATPTPASETMAKGVVPAPTGTKVATGGAAPAGGLVAAATWQDWIMAHPWETAAIGAGVVFALGGVLYAIDRLHKSKQEAPTPGLFPVPVAA